MNEFTTPELSLEDAQYEREAMALEVQHKLLSLAIDLLAKFCTESLRNLEPLEGAQYPPEHWQRRARVNSAKMVLINAQREVSQLIAELDNDQLWTSDECSAAIVEEWQYEAVQEVNRLSAEIDERQKLHLQQYGNLERSD